MESSVQIDTPVFQKFKAEDGSPLTSLRTHLCPETCERFVLWTDIQHAFNGIGHLKPERKKPKRILFTTDAAGE
ncbi:hypothetical protein BGZ59_004228, partial [Podila verticillata]